MVISHTPEAEEHIHYWKKSGNKAVQKKISMLLEIIAITTETGPGKPEQLKHSLSGCWSRRINSEHRIV